MVYTAPGSGAFARKKGSLAVKLNAEFDEIADDIAAVREELEAAELGEIALNSAQILVGNSENASAAVDMSGDVTIDNTGATTIQAKAVEASKIALADGKILIGNAEGAAAACTPSGDVTMTNTGVFSLADGAIDPAVLSVDEAYIIVGDAGDGGAAVAMSGDITIDKDGVTTIGAKKVDPGMVALTEAHILVGDGGAGSDVAVSGDIAIDKLGATTIQAKAVEASMIALADTKLMIGGAGGAAAEYAVSGIIAMTNGGVTTLPLADGKVLVGNGAEPSVAAAVDLSGDVTIDKTGATTIGAKAVEDSMIALTEGHIIVGDGGAGSDVAVSGDVTIDKLGAVTIGAGKVTQAMIAANTLTGTVVDALADDNVIGAIPVIFRIDVPNSATDTDVLSTHKIRVLDFWFLNTGDAAHATDDTIQLKNGSNAISDAIAKTATQYAVKRASTLDPARVEIAAGGTIRITTLKDTNCAATCYVLACRID